MNTARNLHGCRAAACRVLAVVVTVCVMLCARSSWAQTSLRVTAPAAEVGIPFEVSLEALSTDDTIPTRPTLTLPPGLRVVEQSIGTSQRIELSSGGMVRIVALTVNWAVVASSAGDFTLGPAEVMASGKRVKSNAARIHVYAAGKMPPAPQSAFDPWKGILSGAQGDEPEPAADPEVAAFDAKFALPTARAPLMFLHAKADRDAAIVGEQVLLDVYLYEEEGISEPRFSDIHEVPAADFMRRVLSPDEAKFLGRTHVGEKVYSVRLLRQVALFPLKSGVLETGSMSIAFSGRTSLINRESESLSITVREPPTAGRPAGYQLGVTGRFSMKCSAAKTALVAGDATAVTVTVQGTGNLPGTLRPPLAEGVVYLMPEEHETTKVDAHNRVSTERILTYVVRVENQGTIALGRFNLPFYDADRKRYDTAACDAGNISVTPSSRPAVVKAEHALKQLGDLAQDEASPRKRLRVLESPVQLAGAAFAPPVFALAMGGLHAALTRWRKRRRAFAESPAASLANARTAFRAAARGHDASATLAALRELLVRAVDLKCGSGMRAVPEAELQSWLIERGLPLPLAAKLEKLLAAMDTLRFAPSAAASDSIAEMGRDGEQIAREIAAE